MLKSVASLDYIKFSLAAIEKGLQIEAASISYIERRSSAYLFVLVPLSFVLHLSVRKNISIRDERDCIVPTNMRFSRAVIQITGRPFEQMMLVFDLDHISSAHFSCKQFASSFTTLVTLFQEHYPLVLRKILIIRAPEMARIAYASITAILSDPITRLIEMPSEVIWNENIRLPLYLINSCITLLFRYGMGPVPSDYFVDPKRAMADYDQLTTVYAGDKHLISIRIKDKSKIWYV
uniref:CRAL-TRIO domain-containing protein n=1 Tax=Heterorhabditis bacteriophora TaxID=37862 RepID=A0A1I7WT61_HETBA